MINKDAEKEEGGMNSGYLSLVGLLCDGNNSKCMENDVDYYGFVVENCTMNAWKTMWSNKGSINAYTGKR